MGTATDYKIKLVQDAPLGGLPGEFIAVTGPREWYSSLLAWRPDPSRSTELEKPRRVPAAARSRGGALYLSSTLT